MILRLHGLRVVHALKLIGALLATVGLGLSVVMLRAPSLTRPARDTLVVGLDAEPRTLDPHASTASSDFRVLANIYEGLTRFTPGTLTPAPLLAERWDISQDGKQYTFYLKPKLRFQDGTRLDARAVQFNFERMLNPEHPYHHTGPFPLAFFFERVKSISVLAPLVVRFSLDEPFAPLLANLAYPTGYIVSPSAIRKYDKDVGRNPVGSGPFRFIRWDPEERLVLERWHGYHGPAAASARLVFRPIADAMTRVAELRAGQLDLLPELGPDNTSQFRRLKGFHVLERAGPHLWFLIFNLRHAPLSDRRVRQALNLAVDKRGLLMHVLQSTASIASGPVAAAFGAAAGSVAPYPYDPARARALLRSAGVRAGTQLKLAVPQSGSGMLAPIQMATAIQADFRAVGIELSIESYEWNSYLTKVNRGLGNLDMAAMAWMTNDPDTLSFLTLRSTAMPPKGFNSGYYQNAQVDSLLEQARRETSSRQRAELYARVQQLVHDDAPWLFVASWKQNVVINQRVQGLSLEPSFLLGLSGVSKP